MSARVITAIAASLATGVAAIKVGLGFDWSSAVTALPMLVIVCAIAAGFAFAVRALGRAIKRSNGITAGSAVDPSLFPEGVVIARIVVAVSIACFVMSLFRPAFFANSRPWPGIELFLVGWIGAVTMYVGWYANPLLLLTWFLGWHGKYAEATLIGVLATLLALSSRAMTVMLVYDAGPARITGFADGLSFWVASCATAAGGFGFLAVWSAFRRWGTAQ